MNVYFVLIKTLHGDHAAERASAFLEASFCESRQIFKEKK